MPTKLEIERRYLLKRVPNGLGSVPTYRIHQFYGNDDIGRYRVREQTKWNDGIMPAWEWFLTRKKFIEPGISEETEENITQSEFIRLRSRFERMIMKDRYVFPLVGTDLKFEVDDFSTIKLVIAEIELPSLDAMFEMPEMIQRNMIKEVTNDRLFSNYNLAEKNLMNIL